jgi:HSP20 family molecular chaperone IbpA
MNIKTVAKGNILQVSGSRKKTYKDNNAYRNVKHARTLSSFYDEFDFPVALDGKKITVEKRNDVLKLTIPCPEIKLTEVYDKPECPPGAMPVDRHE